MIISYRRLNDIKQPDKDSHALCSGFFYVGKFFNKKNKHIDCQNNRNI